MRCAIDIDIREFTVVDEDGVTLRTPEEYMAAQFIPRDSTVLIEVASPVFYHGDGKAAFTSTARWMIWNSLAAGALANRLRSWNCTILVAPSSKWAMGYDEKTRQAMAGINPLKYKTVKGKQVPIYADNHDIRECKAMLWSHKVKPELWVPMSEYLANL